jgi:hypothetical protein
MALLIGERETVDLAHLLELERTQPRAAGEKALDVVVGAGDEDRYALGAQRPVEGQPLVGRPLSSAAP